MKKLFEIKGYISTYKEEVPIIELVCADKDMSSLEKLREILEMEYTEGPSTNDKAIIRDARKLMENRHKTLSEIERVIKYYRSTYGKLAHLIRSAEKEAKERNAKTE